MQILTVDNVVKRFKHATVLDGLSFGVEEHGVFGFIGKNGAGKTTTMKLILGFLKPDAGEITVCGARVRYGKNETNRQIGYLPDVPEYYGWMTPKEYLRLCGRITGMEQSEAAARGEDLIHMVGLDGVHKRIQGFSRGMRQRLGIAQALLGRPKLLMCDEPTSALDPVGRKEILDLLALSASQTTILFSTHILSDVERICNAVGVLDGGRLRLEGDIAQLKNARRSDRLLLAPADVTPARLPALADALAALPGVERAQVEGLEIRLQLVDAAQAGPAVLRYCLEQSVPIAKYELEEPTLESLFLSATGETAASRA